MVDALLKMDGEILLFIQDHIRQEWMDWFWKAVTHLGDGGVFLSDQKTRKSFCFPKRQDLRELPHCWHCWWGRCSRMSA